MRGNRLHTLWTAKKDFMEVSMFPTVVVVVWWAGPMSTL
jgi:hypothetical protein